MDGNAAALKLKAYLDAGKSYYEASTMLRQEGISQTQIEDAKIELDKQYGDTYQQAARAAMLGQVEQTPVAASGLDPDYNLELEDQRQHLTMRESPNNASFLSSVRGKNGIWIYPASMLVMIVTYIIIKHILHI